MACGLMKYAPTLLQGILRLLTCRAAQASHVREAHISPTFLTRLKEGFIFMVDTEISDFSSP